MDLKNQIQNREIKFRAYVTNLGVPFMAIQGEPDLETLGSFFHHYCGPEQEKLMQFTGLKDQKGNDIYEGDILELNNCGLLIVCFYKGEFKLQKLAEYHKKRNLYASISYLEFSVLRGNIYENTELLTI